MGAMIGLALPQASKAQEEVLSKELKQLSERDAERQARRDLDALLTDFSGYHVGKRFLFQGDVWFWTEPRSSKTEGICERDLLQIFYQPANPRSRDDENMDFLNCHRPARWRQWATVTRPPASMPTASAERN